MSEKQFADGLMVFAPNENAPDFVKCNISIDRKKLGNWLRNKSDDKIKLDVKVGKSGKWYAEVNTWKPKEREPGSDDEPFNDSIPF